MLVPYGLGAIIFCFAFLTAVCIFFPLSVLTKTHVDENSATASKVSNLGSAFGNFDGNTFSISEAKYKENVIYSRVVFNSESIEKNHKLMDLGNPLVDENEKAIITLPADQKSKAIGKSGINIRLASMLTGMNIELVESDATTDEATGEIQESKDGVDALEALFN